MYIYLGDTTHMSKNKCAVTDTLVTVTDGPVTVTDSPVTVTYICSVFVRSVLLP